MISIKKKVVWVPLLVVILAGLTVVSIYLYSQAHQPLIPKAIQGQLTSTLILPSKDSEYQVQPKTVKYSAAEKLLTFVMSDASGQQIIMSEQPTPDQFTDVPQTFTSFLSQAGNYATFSTSLGTVNLIKSANVSAGLTNTKGTLLFARPKANLSQAQYRQLFTHLQVVD